MHSLNLIYSGAAALALNVYTSLFYGKSKERVSIPMINKVIIVTGANTGIGKEIASKLYISGAKVIMACRDEARANEALQQIKENALLLSSSQTKMFGDITFMHLDLSDLKSIPRFVDKFYDTYTSLDVLINNAGLNSKGVTKNGLQQLFQVNYLGHYLLTRLLIQRNGQVNSECLTADNSNSQVCGADNSNVIKSHKIRVVNLSSVMHHFGANDFKTSAFNISPSTNAYSDSKLYMNYLTYQLNKLYSRNHHIIRNGNSMNNENIGNQNDENKDRDSLDVLAVSANPGGVRSDIFRNWKGVKRVILNAIFGLFLDVDEGSETAVYAASASDRELLENMSLYSVSLNPVSYSASIYSKTTSVTSSTSSVDKNNIHMMDTIDFNKTPMKMIGDELIPYLIPYNMPRHISSSSSAAPMIGENQWLLNIKHFLLGSPSIGFEFLGVFAGTVFSPCSVPVLSSTIASKDASIDSGITNSMLVKNIALDTIASSLWTFSEDLCVLKLSEEKFKLQLNA